jgi:hypothetical protein
MPKDSTEPQESEELIRQLKEQIQSLSDKVSSLMQDNADLRQKNYQILITTEQEEEYVSNMLLRQIHKIRKEKGEALDLAEKEEEYLTMLMSKKLHQLQQEKILLENAMEAEQEFLVNKLYKQIEILSNKQRRNALKEPLPPILEALANEINCLETKVTEKKALCRELIQHIFCSGHFRCTKADETPEELNCEHCQLINEQIVHNK